MTKFKIYLTKEKWRKTLEGLVINVSSKSQMHGTVERNYRTEGMYTFFKKVGYCLKE